MSRLTIDTGTAGNAATGDSLRTAFTKVNTNFAELYTELGGDSLDAISFNNNTISTDITNANLILTGNGTGGVVIEDLEITGSTINTLTTNNNLTLNTNGTGQVIINALSINEINSNDSSAIQINDGINVSGQGTFNNTTKFNAGVTIGANVEPDGTYSRQLGAGDKRWVQIYTLNLDMVGSLTVDGTAGQAGQLLQSNGGSYVPAWTSNITVNSIASSDSSAIQINDAVNVSGAGTFHGSVRFNAGYTENINALTSSSTITVNCATASIHTVTLAVSTGFVISNLPTGGSVTLIITQGGSGSYTATFGTDTSTTVKFPGGSPTLSTAVGAIDVVTIFNTGTNYLGNIAKAYA